MKNSHESEEIRTVQILFIYFSHQCIAKTEKSRIHWLQVCEFQTQAQWLYIVKLLKVDVLVSANILSFL